MCGMRSVFFARNSLMRAVRSPITTRFTTGVEISHSWEIARTICMGIFFRRAFLSFACTQTRVVLFVAFWLSQTSAMCICHMGESMVAVVLTVRPMAPMNAVWDMSTVPPSRGTSFLDPTFSTELTSKHSIADMTAGFDPRCPVRGKKL